MQLIRGMDKTVDHLVEELKKLSKDVTDEELKDVATVSAGGNEKVRGGVIALVCAGCAREFGDPISTQASPGMEANFTSGTVGGACML